jgi:ATF/CREB family transcription factor
MLTARKEKAEAVQPPEQPAADTDTKPPTTSAANGASTTQPLGPPPRPSQQNPSDTPDYFSAAHGTQQGPYQAEPNPFEAQFGNPSVETPGKSLLPPLSSLTSPQPLLNGGTPGWPSLRSGPLSPAMLSGPAGGNDYFDQSFSRGFPTPNESGLRSGLTPGGGGSMFPAPSPNSQALFNSLQSATGVATPSTVDFFRTSIGAKAAQQASNYAPTSQPTDPNLQQTMNRSQQDQQQEQYGQQHADQDAVNGLYMLTQASSMRGNGFPVGGQQSIQTSMAPSQSGTHSQDTSPVNKRASKNSIGNMSISNATDEFSGSDQSEPQKPTTRSRGKKAAGGKAAGNRRKAEDTPAKTPANKRSKGNSGISNSSAQDMMMSDDDEVDNSPMADTHPNGKKMTDEEKRKNFLERNRYVIPTIAIAFL